MTDLTLGKRRKKPGIENAVIQVESIQLEPIAELETESDKSFTYVHDDEAGTVDFELTDGTPIRMRSPRTTQFLAVTSWLSTVDPEMRSDEMAVLRVAAACVVKMGKMTSVSMAQLLEKLDETNDIDDVKRLAIAVNCFQAELERFFKRNSIRSAGAGVSG
jgi:hypothetical protein